MAHPIRIGPAGWSYTDWEGVVYPKHGSRFDHLAYLSSFFDTIEINSPFYRIPPPNHARSWVRRVAANRDFKFTTKVFRGFTHENAALARDDVKAFRNYLDPLMDAGRLGAILLQFPWSFKNTPESRAKLEALFAAFDAYPKALEVRHSSFEDDAFYRFLDDRNVGWVNVDQPLFDNSVKPAETTTGPLAYARFHGRNYEKWFAHDESWERYNYLYSAKELEPWVARIESMAQNKDTYVITNNHFRGQAIVNAGELRDSLGQDNKLPPQLKEIYPDRVK
ncbi:MAG: DUF72 domain-containing protein [Acidobacteria bacterium]|nr:DUF72 domain-containing protein [Acidobacteriota bacterium]MBV9477195.1 DUF72 domain-containing protein [Acidobacteriota bacterium]